MYRLEHPIPLAYVGAARRADATLSLGRLIGKNVAVQVGQYQNLELLLSRWVNEGGRHYVYVPPVPFDARVAL